MDLFRSVVRQGEVSERVLRLTEHIIRINPAQYSLWYAQTQAQAQYIARSDGTHLICIMSLVQLVAFVSSIFQAIPCADPDRKEYGSTSRA